MVNTRGELTEVTRATLALKVDETWVDGAAGVRGAFPGSSGPACSTSALLHERVLRRADLDAAVALAVISSLRGWRDARLRVDGAGAAAEGGDEVTPHVAQICQ